MEKTVYLNLRINQRQLWDPPSHPSHWPRCRSGQNSPGCKRVTGLKQPFTNIRGFLAVLVSIFRFTLFLEIKKNIQKQHIRPSPNNQTTKHWSLGETAKVCCIGFLPMNINIKFAPFPPWAWYAYASTQPGRFQRFQIARVGQRCGFGNTRSETNTQSVNVGMPLDHIWYFNIWLFGIDFWSFLECWSRSLDWWKTCFFIHQLEKHISCDEDYAVIPTNCNFANLGSIVFIYLSAFIPKTLCNINVDFMFASCNIAQSFSTNPPQFAWLLKR